MTLRKVIVVLAATVLTGCASGGGGGGTVEVRTTPKPSQNAELQCLWFLPIFCEWVDQTPSLPPSSSPTPFTSWSELPAFTSLAATAIQNRVTYQRLPDGMTSALEIQSPFTTQFNVPSYDNLGKLNYSDTFYWRSGDLKANLGSLGQPGFDLGADPNTSTGTTGTFADFPYQFSLVANPYVLGSNYQSFGVWDAGPSQGIGQISYGAITPGSSVPSSGSATFAGKLAGFYISPNGQGSMAVADLSIAVNFEARSLGFNSSGTFISRNPDVKTDAPNLNLSGTATWTSGSNVFNGSLTNAGGTMTGPTNGLFYGPAGQELGGVFALRSRSTSETLSGAYGARR